MLNFGKGVWKPKYLSPIKGFMKPETDDGSSFYVYLPCLKDEFKIPSMSLCSHYCQKGGTGLINIFGLSEKTTVEY